MGVKELEKLTTEELVKLISPNSDVHKELKRRNIKSSYSTVVGCSIEWVFILFHKQSSHP